MVIGWPASFFWRKVRVVTFLRAGEEETGLVVDTVPSLGVVESANAVFGYPRQRGRGRWLASRSLCDPGAVSCFPHGILAAKMIIQQIVAK